MDVIDVALPGLNGKKKKPAPRKTNSKLKIVS